MKWQVVVERRRWLSRQKNPKREIITEAIDKMSDTFSIKDLIDYVPGASRDMIKLVVKEFKDRGLLVSEGKGRGAKLRKTLDKTCDGD